MLNAVETINAGMQSRFVGAVRRERELTHAELQASAPSIFGATAHESRSARYSYIPTIDVLQALKSEGFLPFAACQTRCREEGKLEFTKHMVRLRHESFLNGTAEANEIVLINSHDGTSSYKLIAGIFRQVCANGLIVGNTFDEVTVNHSGNVKDKVIEGAFTVVNQFAQIDESREEMKAIELNRDEQLAYAKAALQVKWNDEEKPAPVAPEQLLMTRRSYDTANNLWVTFNRVQENLIRGGLEAQRERGARRTRTRSVKSIQQNVNINRALWTLTEEMKNLKAA